MSKEVSMTVGFKRSAPKFMKPGDEDHLTLLMAPWHLIRTAKGRVWADSRGFALYTFGKDTAGMSTCYGKCAIACTRSC